MPKKYPVEVRLFAVQKKRDGHSWDRVVEMLRQEFDLDPPPSRRQMTKWAKSSLPDMVMTEINHRLPEYASEWLSTHRDTLLPLLAEVLRGKDFRILLAKMMFSQMKALFGAQWVETAWAEFTEEEERKAVMPQAINTKLAEGAGRERVSG